jgi:predicted nucleic acid-binding protein
MSVSVVDASALAALLFGEPEGAAVAVRLGDTALVAPALPNFEMANICLKKLRRHPERRNALLMAFAQQTRMAIEIVDIDQGAALRLAEQTGLTTYDAAYLWLSRRLQAALVTLDKQLAAADASGAAP